MVWALAFLVRYVSDSHRLKRFQRFERRQKDDVVATLRLRLPPGAELVTLEHQMYFRDERNRSAAAEVFTKNGFVVKSAETYENETKYWLLANRSTLIDRVDEEFHRVQQFATSFGARYHSCAPQL